jgi:hypothetical protein
MTASREVSVHVAGCCDEHIDLAAREEIVTGS